MPVFRSASMRVHVLGSGAGGGFPQWNCNCPNCRRMRARTLRAKPRSQSSIAISGDGEHWILVNSSPDVRAQILDFVPLQPTQETRGSKICAIVLVDSQLDHTAGLLSLREGKPLKLYCTEMVYRDLTTGFPVLPILEHYCGVTWHPIATDGAPFSVPCAQSLRFTAVPLRSKAPPYSPHRHDSHLGDTIGLRIEDVRSERNLFYAPGLGRLDPQVRQVMAKADVLLVDGTFWSEDEMVRRGAGTKLASAMGHLPQSGPGGMMEALRSLGKPRKVLIHINNTNPILDEDSAQRDLLRAEEIEVAWDGMDLFL